MTTRRQGLPLLPGLQPSSNPVRPKHNKTQQLSFANGLPVVSTSTSPSKSIKRLPSAEASPNATVAKPAWLVYDKQTLSFRAYFVEDVQHSSLERSRVRRCRIFVFPEDDTVEILEDRLPDSGLPQGKLLRRHRVPKPAPNDDEYYSVEDFNVGMDISIYGREYRIVDCDDFTRNFLGRLSIEVGTPEDFPDDEYTSLRETQRASQVPRRPYEKLDTLGKFLKYDRQVLRFYCIWDDRDSEYGEIHYLVLMYFLSDDTIEITRVMQPNSGFDGPATFVKRQKIPKRVPDVKPPGSVSNRTLLNIFANDGLSGRHILDNTVRGSGAEANYTDADLAIGQEITVFGRTILLCDCDEFTKKYYRERYGMEDFTPINPVEEEEAPSAPPAPPPATGFGSEEDSLNSVHSIVPRQPKGNLKRWLKEGSSSLQFRAILETDDPIDQTRQFAIAFYLADDTVAVFEERQRNSGIQGGKFLERSAAKVPGSGRNYEASDFMVGAVVKLAGRVFRVIDASNFAIRYMMENKFPQSDPDEALSNVAENANIEQLLARFTEAKTEDGTVPAEVFDTILAEDAPTLTAQQARMLAFVFATSKERSAPVNADKFVEAVKQASTKEEASTVQSQQAGSVEADEQ